MQVSVERIGNVAIAEILVEELDANNAGALKREMAPILEANSRVIIDLRRLHFVDSSGLGAMVSFLRQLTAKGGDLKLCGMSKPVRATFELVRMHRIFEIFGTREQAVEAFSTLAKQECG